MRRLFLLFLPLLLLVSCAKDSNEVNHPQVTKTYTVAVVLPLSGNDASHWRNTADWALENLRKAQEDLDTLTTLKIEWFDETTEDMASLGATLAARDDVKAIIGPLDQDRLKVMATEAYRKNKPILAPLSGSAEVARIFCEKENFWGLTSSDISQCEILLMMAAKRLVYDLILLCPENQYGNTFKDWLPFQASEMGLNVTKTLTYANNNEMNAALADICSTEFDGTLILVPSNPVEGNEMLEYISNSDLYLPYILLGDRGIDYSDQSNSSFLSLSGAIPYADPESGFDIAYQVHFKQLALSGEAQFYDALMLTTFALAYNANADLNQSLSFITSRKGRILYAWDCESQREIFQRLADHESIPFHIGGASGTLLFDSDFHKVITNTSYMEWTLSNGYVPVSYYSPYGSGATASASANWNWKVTQVQQFDELASRPSYPALHQKWAVVIASSNEWKNYRHQADALQMYQLLRGRGYDDDHILFIIEDDIARNPHNPNPGVVKTSDNGANLYHDIVVDYHTSDLTPEQLPDLLSQMGCDEDDNVLVFWSGHGTNGYLNWVDNREYTTDLFRQTLQQMQGRYRKMLWLVETCYSGSVGVAAEGFPGVIVFTAANANETSKADNFSLDFGTNLTNRFSATLMEAIAANPKISFRELYFTLVNNTIGSHPCVFNASNFDNIYLSSIEEFL